MSAASIYEQDNKLEQAAQVWERVPNEYSGNDQAPTAVFEAGIMRYRESKYSDALKDFQRSLALATQAEDQARANLWIGKTEQQLGQTSDAQSAWQQAQGIDPGGYYSLRARDILLGRDPFAPSSPTNLNFDLTAERKDANSWMRLTFNLPAGTGPHRSRSARPRPALCARHRIMGFGTIGRCSSRVRGFAQFRQRRSGADLSFGKLST